MQQRAQAQAGGSAQAAAENQRRLNQPANLMNQPVNRPNVTGQLAVPGAARQPIVPPGMQAPVAGMANVPAQMAGLVPPLPMNSLPQAQMQALQAQHRINMGAPQANMNLLMQARQISDQQRQAILQQQQQQHQAQLSSPPQGQMSAQQANAGLTPGVPAAQLAQMAQMMHGAQNQINGVSQASPNGIRPTVNGINQQNFMTNAQAQALLSAQYGGINGAGMAGSPVAGLGMGSVSSSSPRSNSGHLDKQYPAYAAQLAELENQYRLKQPGLTADQARHMAHEQFARLIVQKRQQQLSQSAMNAAAGGATPQGLANGLPNGMAASTSPHQYAQMLRAQQQVQAAQANGQQQQQNGPQHQRSSSGGAASVAGK
jgi:chromatin modification-related protein VID21